MEAKFFFFISVLKPTEAPTPPPTPPPPPTIPPARDGMFICRIILYFYVVVALLQSLILFFININRFKASPAF